MPQDFSSNVREAMADVLTRYAHDLQTTPRIDVRTKVSKEEMSFLLERYYLVRANGNEQKYLPGLIAFEDFADSATKNLARNSGAALLQALKLLYAKDQSRGWSQEEIRTACRYELGTVKDQEIQIGMHLVHELRLGNSHFAEDRYIQVFPLEDIVDFQSIDEVWEAQVQNLRKSNQSRSTPAYENSHQTSDLLDDRLPLHRRKSFDYDTTVENLTRQSPVALMMIDLDEFKQINDGFGHSVGDRVLLLCAEALRSAIDLKGKAYRYGGDEFAAILYNFTLNEAVATAERIRRQVAQLRIDGCSRQITLSIGVAAFPDSTSADTLVERADKALYQAKNKGRNRVIEAQKANSKEVDKLSTELPRLRPEDRVAAVDLELKIDQGMRQTFVATINNKSDEEVTLTKVKITCRDVVVVEYEPRDHKTLQPRKQAALSWSCNDDPCNKTRQIEGIWDRDFETFFKVELSAIVLGSLKLCHHTIKVKVEPNSYRIWQLP